jgi:hypothetical protein
MGHVQHAICVIKPITPYRVICETRSTLNLHTNSFALIIVPR